MPIDGEWQNAQAVPASVQKLLDRYYPRLKDGIRYRDGTQAFYGWMLENVDAGSVVLNVGAGPTPPEARRHMRGKVRSVVGVDPDPVVLANEDLDEARVTNGIDLPFADESFDAAYADWTLEHVSDPLPFLREIRRVLRPGGAFWFRTANRNHYATAISAATPHWFHSLVANRIRRLSAGTHEPWRTRYRINRAGTLTGALKVAGFRGQEIRMIESYPAYLLFHPLAFRAGVVYERIVNQLTSLESLRHTIVGRAVR